MWRRLRQSWLYLRPSGLTGRDRVWIASHLSEAQFRLFSAMGEPDQGHACRVARRLAERNAPRHVIEAALLHDCAKPASYGLFWRTIGVLASPWLDSIPADPPERGWRRALQIYRWHDCYGLNLAREAGTSPEALELLASYAEESEAAPAWLGPLKECDDLG